MGSLSNSIPPELSLDFGDDVSVPKAIRYFIKDISLIGDVTEKVSKVDSYVKNLEDEMRKIDAFKRELPLTMFLVNDAVVALKEIWKELMQCKRRDAQPVFEEFIPLKHPNSDEEGEEGEGERDSGEEMKIEMDSKDKKNWMSSVQLWNTNTNPQENHKEEIKIISEEKENQCSRKEQFFQTSRESRDQISSKGFVPFKGFSGFPVRNKQEDKEIGSFQKLCLLNGGLRSHNEKLHLEGGFGSGSGTGIASSNFTVPQPPMLQTSRKQRRCWSPELHRRFVNALQQLGGPNVATPKQIRELMQIDGLTNDEVKSHLQKYRLHTKKNKDKDASTPAPANQSTVLFGGSLWKSQELYGESSKGNRSQSGSPEGPLELATMTRGASSPNDDTMEEDEEDARSESYSWKGQFHKPGKITV